VIFGLGAALGWGAADLLAAIAGRRIGAFRTVVIAQVVSALAISALLVIVRPALGALGTVAGWLIPNALVAALGYFALYRALELGPIHLVSPVLAAYAVIPVVMAVILLHESLGPLTALGVGITIGGAVLTSADLRALRAGTHRMPRALPWAIASAISFGVATYALGWATRRAGWLPSLWLARTSAAVVFALIATVLATRRGPRAGLVPGIDLRPAVVAALALAFVDIGGTASFGYGAEVGLLSIVTAVSAIYPLIPVFGGVTLFGERPAPNQYFGVVLVVLGLVLLGVSA
jgi:drug/metabolite transporter (DMT)-like permease